MILSGRDIQLYMQANKLAIEPIQPSQFQQNGVDLILAAVEPLDKSMSFSGRFLQGCAYLGATAETLSLPDDLMAFVQLRSTWGRRGLLLPPTIVDAGFHGNLTLEIFCGGPTMLAPLGQRFAHLVFAKVSGPAAPYSGKYQHQRGVTRAIDDAEAQ